MLYLTALLSLVFCVAASSTASAAAPSERTWEERTGQVPPAEDLDDLGVTEDDLAKKDKKVQAAQLRVARLFLKANNPKLPAEERAAAFAELFAARRALAKLEIAAAKDRDDLLLQKLQSPDLMPAQKEVIVKQRLELAAAVQFNEARIETINTREKLADPNLSEDARKRLTAKLAENLNAQFEARKRQMAADVTAIDVELANPDTTPERRAELEKRKVGDQLIFNANDKRQEVLEIQARLKSPGLSAADKKALRAELKQAKREALQAQIAAVIYRLKNGDLTGPLRKMLQGQLANLRERKKALGPGKNQETEAQGPVVNATVPEVGGGGPVGQ